MDMSINGKRLINAAAALGLTAFLASGPAPLRGQAKKPRLLRPRGPKNSVRAGQNDRRISKRLLGQAGLSWDRNRFAGIDDRVIFTTGFGYEWVEKSRTQVKNSAGLTYTLRQTVGQDTASFAGLRFRVIAIQKVLENSSLSTQFVFDENLREMNNARV